MLKFTPVAIFLFLSIFLSIKLYPSNKKANILIIADSIGDAIVKPFRPGDKTFPIILQEMLPHNMVINNSIGGSTYFSAYDRFVATLGNSKVNVLIMTLGINDLAVKWPVKSIFTDIDTIATLCKKKKITLLIGVIDPHCFSWMVDDIYYLNSFQNIYDVLANKHKIVFFNFLTKEFIPHTYDGFHLNQEGQILMAQEIYKQLKHNKLI